MIYISLDLSIYLSPCTHKYIHGIYIITIIVMIYHSPRFAQVFVLEAGRVVEEGAPEALLAKASGHLTRMCKQQGLEKRRSLRALRELYKLFISL